MPWGLKRFQQSHQLHFLTFSCYGRRANFVNDRSYSYFECALERVRRSYGMCLYGYVVMPEHVHLLVSEPDVRTLADAMHRWKVSSSKRLRAFRPANELGRPFWEKRSYDRNVRDYEEFGEKLNYIHNNPVKRGLCSRPEDWPWSSCRHYLTGEHGSIEIESEWTARARERARVIASPG